MSLRPVSLSGSQQQPSMIRSFFVGVAIAALAFSSSCNQTAASPEAETPETSAEPAATEAPAEAPRTETIDPAAAFPDLPRLEGKATAVMMVNGAPITIELDGEKAPITAGNFVDLVQKGVYNGTVFHRVVREPRPFVAQGGDPQSKDPSIPVDRLGTGSYNDESGTPRYIPLEILPQGATTALYSQTLGEAGVTVPPQLQHSRGAIAMARSQFPDSASAQFYFTLDTVNFLDGDYAVFGRVTEGMEVVESIEQGDVIDSVEITQGAENLKS